MIYVFGSNKAGLHNVGDALTAKTWHGAVTGKGEGPHGTSYAIPVRDSRMRAVSEEELVDALENFFGYCKLKSVIKFQFNRINFLVPEIDEQFLIKKLRRAPENVILPGMWRGDGFSRVIVAGSRKFINEEFVFERLDFLLKDMDKSKLQIVSGAAPGPDRTGEKWSKSRLGRQATKFPAYWEHQGDQAGFERNSVMAWEGTHLIAFWDGESTGTKDMIDKATRYGLNVRIVYTGDMK